jgi:hypothetical protein
VNLVVSTGSPQVAVPNVVSQTQAAATTAITGAGLIVGTVTSASSTTVPAGSVVSQTPTAGTPIAVGSAVNLVVSTGPPPAPTVDVVVFSDGLGGTTPTFNTAVPGELLLAFAAADGPALSPQTATISGGGLTWSLVRRENTQSGTAEIWKATAAAQLTDVTVSSTLSVTGFQQSLTVVAFRGATGIGDTQSANNFGEVPPSVTVTTTQGNSLVYGVGSDWENALARTLGANQSMVHEYVATGAGDTFWVESGSAAIPLAGTSVQLNTTAPIGHRWNLVSVEIVP